MGWEWYGYGAAAVAAIGHGSYTAPLKSRAANSVNVHPYIMQTYKVVTCFLTSWIVLLFTDDTLKFSPWGLVSGIFWVPGGTLTIFAVRNAGIAISIGVYSSFAVLASYFWGMFIFDEDVKSFWVGFCAIFTITMSLCIMAYASSKSLFSKGKQSGTQEETVSSSQDVSEVLSDSSSLSLNENLLPPESCLELNDGDINSCMDDKSDLNSQEESNVIRIFGRTFNRKIMGIISAVFAGLASGSVLVPMHYAGDDADGLIYVISFGIGALTVLIFGWFLLLCYYAWTEKSFRNGFAALPSFHVRTLWLSGGLAGLSWSVGNIGGIMAVDYLGQGVGFSSTQSALIVSGLWGIYWFKEIRGTNFISLWFLGAFICLGGILLLNYEHVDEEDD